MGVRVDNVFVLWQRCQKKFVFGFRILRYIKWKTSGNNAKLDLEMLGKR